ncbi:MAG TPA: gamma-glutamylcyclotransferase family protein [Natrialbaceae archaeon]|nr:gamma-glutamylcyclotransferase family protein [Natrialbaceae archaeon]
MGDRIPTILVHWLRTDVMDVFVYGTLTDPDRARAVVDDARFRGAARLVGLHVVEGQYPTLAPGGSTPGRILRTEHVEALDAYEGEGAGLYVRVTVPCDDGSTVEAYVGDPTRLGVADAVDWPGAGSFADRVREYVDRNEVVVRLAE